MRSRPGNNGHREDKRPPEHCALDRHATSTPSRSSLASTAPPSSTPPPDHDNLRLHDLQLRTDQQPHLPPKLMGEQRGSRFPAVLVEAEQITEFDWRAVPIGPLDDLEGHRRRIVARESGTAGRPRRVVKAVSVNSREAMVNASDAHGVTVAPSCCMRPNKSASSQISEILPSAIR
jgi:hypothetical protein